MASKVEILSNFMICLGVSALVGGCGVVARSLVRETTGYVSLGPTDDAQVRAAWAYFRSTRSGQTGLVETVAGSGFATPATMGDQIAAAIAADRLKIIDKREFDDTVSGLLNFLVSAPLSNGEMPGRFYSTRTGALIDPPALAHDPGWSAVEAGRLLVWLRILADKYPIYEPYVIKAVARWQTCRAVDDAGRLRRALPSAKGFRNEPDNGSGYADYAAQGFRAWGEAVVTDPAPSDATVRVEDIDFTIVGKEPLLAAPYALLGIEFGWKTPAGGEEAREKETEAKLWAVQAARWQRTGLATARSDFRRTSAPYLVTDAVLADGYPWSTTGDDGQAQPGLALTSTRAAFLMTALHGGDYAKRLLASVGTLYDPGAGWYEGRYEASGAYEWTRTAATNAAVLEALLTKQAGPLFKGSRPLTVPEGTGTSCSLPDAKRPGA